MAKKRIKRKKRREGVAAKFLLIFASVILIFTLGIYLNARIFRLEFIPTYEEFASWFGAGVRPQVSVAEGEIAVHFIDVGQGDCELIVAGDTRVLIDCGEEEYAPDVINYIRNLGFRRLDYIIATHPHDDHIGGMYRVIKEFSIGEILMPEIPEKLVPTTVAFERFLDAIASTGTSARYAGPGESIKLGAGAVLEIISPVHDDYNNLNNFSIACHLYHGDRSFMFTGDIERASESDIINSSAYIVSDVIKIAHHGSTSSSTPSFLNCVKPKYAVINVGKGNVYGHPTPEVLDRLYQLGCEVLTTMECGNIVIVCDGNELSFYTEKDVKWETRNDDR